MIILEAVDKIQEEKACLAHVFEFVDWFSGGFFDYVKLVLVFRIPLEALVKGTSFDLASGQLETVGDPRLLNHDQIFFRQTKGVVIGETGSHS